MSCKYCKSENEVKEMIKLKPQKYGEGDILVCKFPPETPADELHEFKLFVERVLNEYGINVPMVLMPNNFDLDNYTVAELTRFRDRINEVLGEG